MTPNEPDGRYTPLVRDITPEPITGDGLRGAGFTECGSTGILLRDRTDGAGYPCLQYSGGTVWLVTRKVDYRLHITDMQHLRSVIAALEGVK